jgi:hypothetical protein
MPATTETGAVGNHRRLVPRKLPESPAGGWFLEETT